MVVGSLSSSFCVKQIVYHSSFAIDGYYWWVDAASYAVLLGAIVFTIMGFIAVRITKLTS